MTSDATTISQLDALMTAIGGYGDPRKATGEWKQVYKLLQGTSLPSSRIMHVVGMRDMDGLKELVDQLRAPKSAPAPPDAPDAETCRKALYAFRKRLSLTILDEESKLGRSPLSKGADSRVAAAIVPPSEWPDAVWQELVRQGKLRYVGHRLYELVKQ